MYANPHNRGAVVNQLDTMILGATEIDVDFNVNVTTGTDGVIMEDRPCRRGYGSRRPAPHQDHVTLNAGGYAKVVDQVGAKITTPGETVDVLVTEEGIAVNPRRSELRDRLVEAGLNLRDIEELKIIAGGARRGPATTGQDRRPATVGRSWNIAMGPSATWSPRFRDGVCRWPKPEMILRRRAAFSSPTAPRLMQSGSYHHTR